QAREIRAPRDAPEDYERAAIGRTLVASPAEPREPLREAHRRRSTPMKLGQVQREGLSAEASREPTVRLGLTALGDDHIEVVGADAPRAEKRERRQRREAVAPARA